MKSGKTNNPNGRPKGVPNKATSSMREKINSFLEDNWKELQKDFKDLNPKERFDFYIKLLSYSLPQLKSVEHSGIINSRLEQLTEQQLNELINQILNHD